MFTLKQDESEHKQKVTFTDNLVLKSSQLLRYFF